MIRVGIAGYGLAGSVFHAPLVAATPGMAVTGIVTTDLARAAQARREHPDARVVPDVDALLGLGIDLLVVASTNASHVPLARAGIAAGVAVVVDKPLAPTATEGAAVVLEASVAAVVLTTFQNRRWDSDYRTLRTLVDSGVLGDVRRLESRFERWRPQLGGGWRERDEPGQAGGLLFDLGSHLVDQALVLLGPVVSVYAEVDRRRSPEAADDDVFIALEHANGTRSHLWASAVTPMLGPRFRVLGSRAGYVVHGLDAQEDALRDGARPGPGWGAVPVERWGVIGAGGVEEPVASLPGDYPAFYAQLVRTLTDGAPVPVDPSDSVRGLQILETARTSSETRAVIPLPAPLLPDPKNLP